MLVLLLILLFLLLELGTPNQIYFDIKFKGLGEYLMKNFVLLLGMLDKRCIIFTISFLEIP